MWCMRVEYGWKEHTLINNKITYWDMDAKDDVYNGTSIFVYDTRSQRHTYFRCSSRDQFSKTSCHNLWAMGCVLCCIHLFYAV